MMFLPIALADEPEVPSVAADPGGFAPAGYTLTRVAWGDLDGQGKPDMAAVYSTEDPDAPRLLVFALRAEDGGLRRDASSTTALFCAGCGGVLGDPFQDIAVQKRVVTVTQGGGSRWMWSYVHRYQRGADGWVVAGEKVGSLDRSTEAEDVIDMDLSTGHAVHTTVGEGGKPRREARVRLLLAGLEQEGAPLTLGASDVRVGTPDADLSASIRAKVVEDTLSLRVEVRDPTPGAQDGIRVLGPDGPLPLVNPALVRTETGWTLTADVAVADAWDAKSCDLPGPGDRLRLDIEVADDDGGRVARLSTGFVGRGAIRVMGGGALTDVVAGGTCH